MRLDLMIHRYQMGIDENDGDNVVVISLVQG